VEKGRLHHAYHHATVEYSRATEVLNWTRGTIPVEEYGKLRQSIAEARARSEEAREAMDQHIAEHGC
jgi:hypothetical protein